VARTAEAGLTLIEVLAALALLGSVLVALLLARSEHERQWHAGRQRAEAVRVADELLTDWWDNPGAIPREGRGEIDGHSGWTWRTTTRQPSGDVFSREGAAVEVVAVTVRGPEASEQDGIDGATVTVELLMPRPAQSEPDTEAAP